VTISPDKAHIRSLKAAAGLRRSFLDQAGGDPILAERIRSEFYSEMGKRSGSRRRAKAHARRRAEVAELERAGLHITTMEELEKLLAAARAQVRR
jgi:hypothetical protein